MWKRQQLGSKGDKNIKLLHRNMLYPIQSVQDDDVVIDKATTLMKVNQLMDAYFSF